MPDVIPPGCGAALADLGLPPDLRRGIALLARTAGLLGHIAEEQHRPIAMDIYLNVEHNTDYQMPDIGQGAHESE